MTFVTPNNVLLTNNNFRQLPPVWEMSQPFNIDPAGEVAYDADPVSWARNHILAVLLTNPGERVMRPGYGAGIYNFVFENDDPLTEAQIINERSSDAVATWEPNITLNGIALHPADRTTAGTVLLDIAFTVGNAPTVYSVSVTLGGTGVEVPVLPA